MPGDWQRVDSSASLSGSLTPSQLFDRIAGGQPWAAIIDCRKILRIGLLPRSRVLRRKGCESIDEALHRVIDEMMWEDPPDDHTTAILVGECGDEEESDDAAEIAAAAAYLRKHFGTTCVLGLAGGARALDADPAYRLLLGMLPARAATLPSRLSAKLLVGSTASAEDATAMQALGVTHLVSVINRPFRSAHFEAARHRTIRAGGVAREQGSDDLRALLIEALPFILAATESQTNVVLVHADAPSGPTAAAAIACAALVADGTSTSDLGVDIAARHLAQVRPASALHDAALTQLRACETWLRDGAPGEAAESAAVDVGDGGLGAPEATMEREHAAARLRDLAVSGGKPAAKPDDGVRAALHRASDLVQAEMLARLPAPDDDSDDDGRA